MDAVVKKVDVLDTSDGNVRTVQQFIVKIGRTLMSRHSDEESANTAANEANAARQRFVERIRRNRG